MKVAKKITGYLQSYELDPYMVLPIACGCAGFHDLRVQPMEDNSTSYVQLIWMTQSSNRISAAYPEKEKVLVQYEIIIILLSSDCVSLL